MQRFLEAVAIPLLRATGNVQTINSQTIRVIEEDDAGDILFCTGKVVPTAAGSGYAKGCKFIDTDVGAGLSGVYENIGTNTSCDFQPQDDEAPNEITLANGKIIVGDNTGFGAAKTLGATGAFTGSALATHAHTSGYVSELIATKETFERLYTGTVGGAGSGIIVGSTLLQATSTATGTVVAIGTGYVDINTITGTFDASHVVTSTNPDTTHNTFTPTMTALDVWTLSTDAAAITAIANNAGAAVAIVQAAVLLTTGKTRYKASSHQFCTLLSDAYSSITVDYAPKTSSAVSGGTPAGSVAVTPTYS